MKTHRHLILLAVCLGGMGSLHAAGERVKPSRACPPSVRGHHLEIKALAAPGMVDPHERFNTFVTAVDERGVGFIDVEFNDQKVRIDGKGERFVTAIAVFSARPPGVPRVDNTSRTDTLNTLRATVVAVDGRTRGAPRIKQVGVEGPEATQATEPMADFRERLADINYPAITGATANASWNVTPLSVDLRPWWTKWVEKGGPQHWNWAGHVEPGITAIGEDGKVLRAWLDLHPNVASNLVWAELDPTLGSKDPWGMPAGAVTHLSYPYWTDFMKYQLNIAVFRAWQYLNSGAASFNGTPLPPIAKNRMTLADHEGSTTLLNRDDAWNLYLGTVAHSLAVEIGGFVPWSITNYKLSDLSVLLNAVTMYDHIGGLSWYVTTTETRSASGYFVHQVLPAPPVVNFNFMLEHDMIRPDHTRTITRYFDWGRKAFYHTGVRLDPKGKVQDGTDAFSAEAYWGYRGATPASQVQKGTYYTLPAPWNVNDPHRNSWVIGCPSMSYFTQQTMRAVNIPVQVGNVGQTLHTTPFFWTIGSTLSHGDDLYHDGGSPSTPPFPSKWFLIPMAVYNDWFYGNGILGPGGYGNVGRQPAVEIPLKALSDELVQRYCADKAANATHANGTVAAFFQYEYLGKSPYKVTYYSVAQLEALNLWPRLHAKAVALGFIAP